MTSDRIKAKQIFLHSNRSDPFIADALKANTLHFTDRGFIVNTLDGNIFANYGSYLICGYNNEYYPCRPDIFEEQNDKKEI